MDARIWNGLVGVAKDTYTASLGEVNFSLAPIELDHPDPVGVTAVLMDEDGYRISLTGAFAC